MSTPDIAGSDQKLLKQQMPWAESPRHLYCLLVMFCFDKKHALQVSRKTNPQSREARAGWKGGKRAVRKIGRSRKGTPDFEWSGPCSDVAEMERLEFYQRVKML